MKNIKNVSPKIRRSYVYASLVLAVLAGVSAVYIVNTSSCRDCIYNQDGIKITGTELNQAIKTRETFYNFNKQEVSADILKNDVIEQLKNEKRVEKYAQENNIKVTEQEINEIYADRIKQNNSEEDLLKKVSDMYGFTKADYLTVLENDILHEKVQAKIAEPLADWLNKQPD